MQDLLLLQKHYHGTSMTVMQFLSEDNRGETQSRIEKIEEIVNVQRMK